MSIWEILTGGLIKTYLLEKICITSKGPVEHNYHIFYKLLVGLGTTLSGWGGRQPLLAYWSFGTETDDNSNVDANVGACKEMSFLF